MEKREKVVGGWRERDQTPYLRFWKLKENGRLV